MSYLFHHESNRTFKRIPYGSVLFFLLCTPGCVRLNGFRGIDMWHLRRLPSFSHTYSLVLFLLQTKFLCRLHKCLHHVCPWKIPFPVIRLTTDPRPVLSRNPSSCATNLSHTNLCLCVGFCINRGKGASEKRTNHHLYITQKTKQYLSHIRDCT